MTYAQIVKMYSQAARIRSKFNNGICANYLLDYAYATLRGTYA